MTNQSGLVMKDKNVCHCLKKGRRGQRTQSHILRKCNFVFPAVYISSLWFK